MNDMQLNGWSALIAVLIPFVTAGIKQLAPRIPKILIPVIAVLIGTASNWVMDRYGFTDGGAIVGALLGAAGVALREFADQTKKAVIAMHDEKPLPRTGDKIK